MNIENLKDVFNNLLSDNNRAILVDGAWGIGKTYHILQFLKEAKKSKVKQKIVYVSLFGKTSIDEVHTEIYARLHPIKQNSKKIIQVIPKVAPLLGTFADVISSLEFALKDNSLDKEADDTTLNSTPEETPNNASVSNSITTIGEAADKINGFNMNLDRSKLDVSKKQKNIIILDDFERLDFQKISFIDVLGYVNGLFLQNFKVVVICNSKEIPKLEENNFTSFKEKVFDREFIITSTNQEVIKQYFVGKNVNLDNSIICEFDNNLRIANRVSNFYSEVIARIKDICPQYYNEITNDTILFACTVTVVSCCTTKYSNPKSVDESLTDMMMLSELNIDESLQNHVLNINNHIKNENLGKISNKLIAGLLSLYYYNDINILSTYFSKNEQKLENPLLEEAFLLSDNDKINLFDRQYDYIMNQNKISGGSIYKVVKNMCEYQKYSKIDEREKDIILNILKKCDEIDVYRLLDIQFSQEKENERFLEFRKNLKETSFNIDLERMCSILKQSYADNDYAMLEDRINLLSRESVYMQIKNGKKELNGAVLKTIEECNFFIDNLFGTITYQQWGVAHQICELSVECCFSDRVEQFIHSLSFEQDDSSKERYNFLLKNKLRVIE